MATLSPAAVESWGTPVVHAEHSALQNVVREVRPAAFPFFLLALYYLTQAYSIPILKIGPSWAVWPALNDFALGLIFVAGLTSSSPGYKPSQSLIKMRQALAWVIVVAICSYVLINLGLNRSRNVEGGEFGLFYVYRYIQAVIMFWCATTVPMTGNRIKWLVRVLSVVLLVNCLAIIATKFFGLTGRMIAPHMPSAMWAGPWRSYGLNEVKGYGTVGFNHALDSSQIILLIALRISLAGKKDHLFNFFFLMLGVAATFASGSRAGFACMALFALIMLVRNPSFALILSLVIGAVALFAPSQYFENKELNKALNKQSKIADPFKAEQFVARTTIWENYARAFSQRPHLMLIGAGVGGSEDVAGAAHSMPLMVVAEFGIFGLLAVLYAAYSVTRMIYSADPNPKGFFWGHVVIVLSCITQETLYPVPAMGHFLPMYLAAVAICVNRTHPFALANQANPDAAIAQRSINPAALELPPNVAQSTPQAWQRVRFRRSAE